MATAFAATPDYAARAKDAYAAMQSPRNFYQGSSKLYREFYPYDASLDRPNGYLWSFEEAAKATLSLYGMPGAAKAYASAVQDRFNARETYLDQSLTAVRAYRSYPVDGDRYYDDNCWTGSNLLQHHLSTATAATSVALDRAKAVFSYIRTGWTTDLPNAGGVRWVDASFNGDRAADSTAGWAKLGAHLYDASGRDTATYRDTAIQAYTWLKTYLRAGNGLYANSMRADGQIDPKQWIYNQGIVIGAAVLLHRVTGGAQYLDDAVSLADLTLTTFGKDPYYSGPDGAYAGRAIFNAIFFRNLLMLYAVTHTDRYVQAMRQYADAVWSDPQVHDTRTNLFKLNGGSRHSLLDQAAMVQVFALLSWSQTAYARLA